MVIGDQAQTGNYAVAFMIAVCLIILGISWAFPVNQMTSMARNQSSEIGGMACSNATTDDFTKAGCMVADIGQTYFIGGIIAIAGLVIVARIIFT